jgi:hypothetical protein
MIVKIEGRCAGALFYAQTASQDYACECEARAAVVHSRY